jgi:hypothetical protein
MCGFSPCRLSSGVQDMAMKWPVRFLTRIPLVIVNPTGPAPRALPRHPIRVRERSRLQLSPLRALLASPRSLRAVLPARAVSGGPAHARSMTRTIRPNVSGGNGQPVYFCSKTLRQ